MKDPRDCLHENVKRPEFDPKEAMALNSHGVRLRFPRYQTTCEKCGKFLTVYHSEAHRTAGGW